MLATCEFCKPGTAMQLRTVQLGTPRLKDEGLRIGTVRLLPRGVKKQDYARKDYFDVWLPILAPSRELLREFKNRELTPAAFFRRYKKEMSAPECRQTLQLLAAFAQRTPVSVGCYCQDESLCHRGVLVELIRAAVK